MIGKNYDAEIHGLVEAISTQNKTILTLQEEINALHELFTLIQRDMVLIAKVQASHKEAIIKLAGV